MDQATIEKKQRLADELDRLATVIEALTVENSKLKDVIDTLVHEVEDSPNVKRCWFDKRDYSVHIVWNWK